MASKTNKILIDDGNFALLASELNKLTNMYQLPKGSSGQLTHHAYADHYDRTIDRFGLTKQQFLEEVKRRASKR